MRIVIAMLSILFAASIVFIAAMNTTRIEVILWPQQPEYTFPETPVSWVIFFSALAGFVFTGIVAILEGSKIRLSNARLRAQVKKLQQEVEILRRPSLDFSRAPQPPPEMTESEPAEDDETAAGA